MERTDTGAIIFRADNVSEMSDPKIKHSGIAEASPIIFSQSVKHSVLPEFILLMLPPKPEALPGKPELGQGLDGTASLFAVETMPFFVLIPIAKTQTLPC